MTTSYVGGFSLGDINVAAATSISLVSPLIGQFDAALFGSFGLSGNLADVNLQMSATMGSLSLSPSISSGGVDALLNSLNVILDLLANPTGFLPSIGLSASISAPALLAGLDAKLAGITSLIDLGISVKTPVVNFMGSLSLSLAASGVHLISFGLPDPPGDTLLSTGTQIQALCAAGFGGVLPGDQVYGLLLVTKSASAWAAIQATMRTS